MGCALLASRFKESKAKDTNYTLQLFLCDKASFLRSLYSLRRGLLNFFRFLPKFNPNADELVLIDVPIELLAIRRKHR